MSQWHSFLSDVQGHIRALAESGCDMPFYRGHSAADWKLLCSLGRQPPEEFKKKNVESILYYDFLSLGGPMVAGDGHSWDILFAMQHHGLPTRLLDWTTTFAVALYFALKPPRSTPLENPSIWVLDPFELNRLTTKEARIFNPKTDFEGTYQENFIEESKEFDGDVVALNPIRSSSRLAVQKSVFTLHSDLFVPLEILAKNVTRKFVIPSECFDEAFVFLELAGVNEFSLFPDLDGLARHLRHEHVDWGTE